MYPRIIKRIIDLIASLTGLIITLPITVLVAVAIWILTGKSPFFVQPRPGLNEKIFRLIKFKTMNDQKDESGDLLPDQVRLTWWGKLLRKSSVDELPQLINVLLGQMSLIGPRPWLVEYLPLYNKRQRKRHYVKPGITGWAQVNGRNLMSWQDRFDYDIFYVENISFTLDVKIMFRTIKSIFTAKGVSGTTSVTMERFWGNSSEDE